MFEAAALEFPLIEPLTEFTADRTTAMIIGTTLGGVVYEETLGGTYARGVPQAPAPGRPRGPAERGAAAVQPLVRAARRDRVAAAGD